MKTTWIWISASATDTFASIIHRTNMQSKKNKKAKEMEERQKNRNRFSRVSIWWHSWCWNIFHLWVSHIEKNTIPKTMLCIFKKVHARKTKEKTGEPFQQWTWARVCDPICVRKKIRNLWYSQILLANTSLFCQCIQIKQHIHVSNHFVSPSFDTCHLCMLIGLLFFDLFSFFVCLIQLAGKKFHWNVYAEERKERETRTL